MATNHRYFPLPEGLKVILRALKYRNFRLFFIGQSFSLIGTWMQTIAMSWLVFRLTNSSFLLGVVGFASQVPTFLMGPLAGVLIDRWNRHRLLIATQSLSMLQAFVLAFLTLQGRIAVWHIIALSFLLGLVNAFDIPGRQAFFIDMIDRKEDLGNAIALNSSTFNGARLIGPSIAGILIALFGEGICFLINGISYLTIIIALMAMNISLKKPEPRKTYLIRELAEGFQYAFGFAPFKSILLLLALTSFMGMPYTVLMPIFATTILHGGADTLGFLIGASGVGALLGAMYLAARKSVVGLGRVIAINSCLFGLALAAFSLSRLFWLSLIMLFLVGFGMMVHLAASNTVLQTIVEEDKRGRLMSLFMMAFIGMEPFGTLTAGSLASIIGAPLTLMIGGISCTLGALLFARKLPAMRDMIRPIYVKLGILPEVASGIQAAQGWLFTRRL